MWVLEYFLVLYFANSHLYILVSGSSGDQTRLVAAAQVIVDMVDSEGESSSSKSLVERLEEAPKKFFDIMMTTSKNYLTHMIGMVKSYWPQHNLAPIVSVFTAKFAQGYP